MPPWQTGETAQLLLQLQRAGHALPDTWVITAEQFQHFTHKLIAREPIYADWPELLWQTESTTGYPVQHLAKRLRRPLMSQASEMPWAELLAHIETPVVRLLPSLWFGEQLPTAPFRQMLATPLCWADSEALEAALKQLWGSVVNAKSLAFWSRWREHQTPTATNYPLQISVAVIVQAVEPALLSGTFTVRTNDVEIAMVKGLPEAIAESCPDVYRGRCPNAPRFQWQPGFQERSYQPCSSEGGNSALADCYTTEPLSQTAQDILDEDTAAHLWTAVKKLVPWAQHPLRVQWSISEQQRHLQVLEAYWWPLKSSAPEIVSLATPALGILGLGASPGQGYGSALVLRPTDVLPSSAHQQIIIATEVHPEWLPLLKTAAGVISEQGGLTSHAAVLARELGLPAVVGVPNATRRFQMGEALRVDGDRGLIEPLDSLPSEPYQSRFPAAISIASTGPEIWLNLSQPENAEQFAKLPVAGIGLLRSEWLMMSVLDRQHPYYWLVQGNQAELKRRLLNQLRPILSAFAPRPVRYRTLDIRSNEFAQLQGAPAVESNPMLGVRGAFSYRQHSAFYEFELDLLRQLQAEGYDNLQLIVPFVRTVEEIVFCQEKIRAMGLSQPPNFALWMMAEVPSVLFSLPQYVDAGVEGIAIGTHDLTQLLLGIDRDQALFSPYFDETHPAVEAAIAQLIQQSQQFGLPSCLCGASPRQHPSFVAAMIRQGVTGISVDANALPTTSQLIQKNFVT